MQLNITNITGGNLGEVKQQVFINNTRRPDVYCVRCSQSSGDQSGTAELSLLNTTQYDAKLLNENDIVEVYVIGFGIVFRGFITNRNSDWGDDERISYTALDLIEKLNDTFFVHDYGYEDPVSKEILYPYNALQIAIDTNELYLYWRSQKNWTDYALSFDFDTFPQTSAGLQALKGQPLLTGLRQVIEFYDYRLRLGVKHTSSGSVVYCYMLGQGAAKNILRATDPSKSPYDQPAGRSNAGNINKQVNASNTISSVYAEGDARLIETSINITNGWYQVANDYTPPSGYVIQQFVTDIEASGVINNWEKYTVEQMDLAGADNENVTIVNPNYRRKYEDVARRYLIPSIADTYTFNDDPEYPLRGRNHYVQMASNLVQTWGNTELKPFIVYRRGIEPSGTYHVKFDGFSIQDTYLEFNKPFVDTVNHIKAKGKAGTWNDTSNNFAMDSTPSGVTSGYLYLPDYNSHYEITGIEDNLVSINGYASGVSEIPWFILDRSPFVACGASGVGAIEGVYQIDTTESNTLSNEYSGMFLVLGTYETDSFTEPPESIKTYRISYNTSSHLFVDDETTDLSSVTGNWCIVDPRTESYTQFAEIYLNAAYPSEQRLTYESADLCEVKAKRIVYKQSNDYKWNTQRYNWILTPDPISPDKFSAVLNPSGIDTTNQLTELATWALGTVQGKYQYETQYDIDLPFMDLGIYIGDMLLDNRVETGTTVTAVELDFVNYNTRISAQSY